MVWQAQKIIGKTLQGFEPKAVRFELLTRGFVAQCFDSK